MSFLTKIFGPCGFGHTWTKWTRKVKKYHRSIAGEWQKGPKGDLLTHYEYYLESSCQTCGVVEQRKLDEGAGVDVK